ncbi:MAG: hypothetical protein GX335_09390 [Firmicutes bacterium]|nr:hypothetical protein [Bacillota bacterium]
MLCEKCGLNEATVRFVKIENNLKTELHLCQSCAQGYTNLTVGLDLQNILSSLFQSGPLRSKIGQEQKRCSTCNLSLKDIQKSGRLGCGECYQTFEEELNPVLRRVHGSVNHTGKIPVRGRAKEHLNRQIEESRKNLEECIRTENYEQAAYYRDQIRRLEGELREGKADEKD